MAYANREDMIKYNNRWQQENRDRVTLLLPKGAKEAIRKHTGGESLNGYINRLIAEDMKKG